MKVSFLTRLNTWLFVIPVLLILILYFAVGFWFYISGATHVLKDFHSAQLVTMLSDKKNAIDFWGDVRKKALDEMARNSAVVNGLNVIIKEQEVNDESDASGSKGKKSVAAVAEARQKIAGFIGGFGQFREISILSPEGKILWSTNGESTGREWVDKDIFGKAAAGKSDLIAGKTGLAVNSEGLLFTAPVMAEGQKLQALIVAIPNPADLAASLKVEKGFYETGKVSIIDTEGNVVAAKDMTDVGKVRYNIRPGSIEEVGYRDGLYYSVTPLRSGQLRLIATLDGAEAAKPLRPLTKVYLSFAGMIVAVMLLQGFLVAPRLIEKPLAKLIKATQSVADEDMRVNLRRGFTGELRMLAEGFSQMIVSLSRKRPASRKETYAIESGRSKESVPDNFSEEIKARLEGIATNLAASVTDESGHKKDIEDAATEIKGLAATIVDFNQLIRLREEIVSMPKKEFAVCELLTEIEGACLGMVGGKEVELIVECPETISGLAVPVERQLLKILGTALLRNAIGKTEIGTVTLLPSHVTRDGGEYFGLAVSDTGLGLDQQLLGKIMKKNVFMPAYLDLCLAREAVDMLGGRMAIDSMPGNGTLVTVSIPVSEPRQGDPEPATAA